MLTRGRISVKTISKSCLVLYAIFLVVFTTFSLTIPKLNSQDNLIANQLSMGMKNRNSNGKIPTWAQNGLFITWWDEICLSKDQALNTVLWHPLFPTIPEGTEILYESRYRTIKRKRFYRVQGFLNVLSTGAFEFKVTCQDSCLFLFTEASGSEGTPQQNGANDIYHELRNSSVAKRITLKSQTEYHLEIICRGKGFDLKWKKPGANKFETIKRKNLSNRGIVKQALKGYQEPQSLFQIDEFEDRRLNFYKRTDFNINITTDKLSCKKGIGKRVVVKKKFDGYLRNLHKSLYVVTYPNEMFNHTESHPNLEKIEAIRAANFVFKKLNESIVYG